MIESICFSVPAHTGVLGAELYRMTGGGGGEQGREATFPLFVTLSCDGLSFIMPDARLLP